jgi:hypothetical protein
MIGQVFGFVLAFVFLAAVASGSVAFLVNPERLLTWVRSRGIYIPVSEFAKTRSGRIELRIMGAVVFLVCVAAATVFISALRNSS